jgi:hypothetical protein
MLRIRVDMVGLPEREIRHVDFFINDKVFAVPGESAIARRPTVVRHEIDGKSKAFS